MPPQFWKLWTANAISNLGDGIALTAFPLLAVLLTRDPALVAGLTLVLRLPWLLLSLPIGALIDRLDRRRVMTAMSLARTALLIVLGFTVAIDQMRLSLLYGIAFLLGSTEVIFDIAAQTIVPSIIPADHLEAANSRLYAGTVLGNQFVGPPTGGLLFGITAALPFLLQGAMLAGAAVLINALQGQFRAAPADDAARPGLWREISEGLRWLWRHRILRTIAIIAGLTNLLTTAVHSIFVLYALDVLGTSEQGYGFLLMAGAVGGILATLVAERIPQRLGPGTALISVILMEGVPYALIVIFADMYVAALMFAISSFAVIVWSVIVVSLRQMLIPDQLIGRVSSVSRMIAFGTLPLGAALGGFLGRTWGLSAPFWLTTVGFIGIAVAVLPIINNQTIAATRGQAA